MDEKMNVDSFFKIAVSMNSRTKVNRKIFLPSNPGQNFQLVTIP
jgi:hypothetical protein